MTRHGRSPPAGRAMLLRRDQPRHRDARPPARTALEARNRSARLSARVRGFAASVSAASCMDATVMVDPADQRCESERSSPSNSSAFARHASAARIHGVPHSCPARRAVSVLQQRHRRMAGRRPLPRWLDRTLAVVVVGRLRVSRPLPDSSSSSPGSSRSCDLVVVGDNLRSQWSERRAPSVVRVRALASRASWQPERRRKCGRSFVRERLDSPMETRLRMLLVTRPGLPRRPR